MVIWSKIRHFIQVIIIPNKVDFIQDLNVIDESSKSKIEIRSMASVLRLMITEKVLLCGNTLMKCCCGATLYFLRQGARSKASNFILCLELY